MAKNLKKNKEEKRNQEKKHKGRAIITKESDLRAICEGNKVLKPYCKSGLQALKSEYRGKIKVRDKKLFGSSLDLDGALKREFHNKHRWDYGFEYEGNFIFIEFHPAQTSEVDKMCKKVLFTKSWIESNCPKILSLPQFETEDRQFYWVATGNNDVRLNPLGAQSKKLAQAKIEIVGSIFDYSKLKKMS